MFLLLLAACAPDLLPLEHAPPPLELDVSAVLPGQTAAFAATGANPGETVYFVRGSQPGTTCPPQTGGLCLDMAGPLTVLASRRANPAGVATWSYRVPAATPHGATLTFQAVVLRAGGGLSSDVERRTIGQTAVPTCGDGVIVSTERCDDGNTTPGDGCDSRCELETCYIGRDLRGWFELDHTSGLQDLTVVDTSWTTDGDLLLVTEADQGFGPRSTFSRLDAWSLTPLLSDMLWDNDLTLRATAGTTVAWGMSWLAGELDAGGPTGVDVALWRGVRLDLQPQWWQYALDGDEAITEIVATPDDGLVIVGGWQETPQSDERGFVLRVDASGHVVWSTAIDRHAGPERVDGARVRPDGGVTVWSVIQTTPRARLLVQTLAANGAPTWQGELDVPGPLHIDDAHLFGRGDVVLLGESGSRVLYTHLGFEGVRRGGYVLGPVQGAAQAGAVARLPFDCLDTSISTGSACATSGDRCANLMAETCSCNGSAWTCTPDSPRIYVQWSAPQASEPWRVTDMHTALRTTWAADDPSLVNLRGPIGSLRDGLAIGLAGGGLQPSVLRFDEQLDLGCGRSTTTDLSVAGDAGTWTWRNAPGPAASNALFTGAPLAAPSISGGASPQVWVRCMGGDCL